jgi:hypothetical protein
MGLREDIQKRIEKKQQELADREMAFAIERASTAAYIQAMQDMLKSLPRDPGDARSANLVLRPGSAMAQAREAIQKVGKPLHISDILRAIGRPVDKETRTSIGGSISNYVRRGEVFTRTAPNTFGLVGMESGTPSEPPDGFGKVRSVNFPGEGDEAETSSPLEEDEDVPF